VGIAIDEEGMLFVANCGSNAIVEVTPDGESTVFATDPLLSCPNGIVLDEEHNLYVACFNNGDVIKISWAGEVTRLATLPGKNNGHLVYREGLLYVVARGAHQIYKVSLEGEVELLAGSGKRGRDDGPALEATFSFPNDLAFSPDGKTLYVNENGSTTEPHTELAPMVVRRIRLGE
jgi:DNA-binding beta-propeller fold protein YncE